MWLEVTAVEGYPVKIQHTFSDDGLQQCLAWHVGYACLHVVSQYWYKVTVHVLPTAQTTVLFVFAAYLHATCQIQLLLSEALLLYSCANTLN